MPSLRLQIGRGNSVILYVFVVFTILFCCSACIFIRQRSVRCECMGEQKWRGMRVERSSIKAFSQSFRKYGLSHHTRQKALVVVPHSRTASTKYLQQVFDEIFPKRVLLNKVGKQSLIEFPLKWCQFVIISGKNSCQVPISGSSSISLQARK